MTTWKGMIIFNPMTMIEAVCKGTQEEAEAGAEVEAGLKAEVQVGLTAEAGEEKVLRVLVGAEAGVEVMAMQGLTQGVLVLW